MTRLGVWGALLVLASAACGGGGDAPATQGAAGAGASSGAAGAAGGGAGAGGGDPADLPDATDVLSPSQYDCTATTAPVPPPRPIPAGCWHDPSCKARFVTQHRIGGVFAPENTASGIRAAILVGADIVETDVRLTADGHVVLIHDGKVDRTFEGTGEVSKLTLADIQAMKVKPEPTDPKTGDFGCEKVLTLEAAMAIAQGKIVVEFETKSLEAGIATAKYLKEKGLYGSAYVQCTLDECEPIRAAVPDVPIMLRAKDPTDLDQLAKYVPIAVEIDATPSWLEPGAVGKIHAAGAKVFTNGFLDADIVAKGSGDLSGYLSLYDRGADAVQTEYGYWALLALGRLTSGK